MGDVPRRSMAVVTERLTGFRAVVVNGPRQAGKSTLVKQVQASRGPAISLDDPVELDLARTDPIGFLDRLRRPAAIDEFQRGGERLLLAVKQLLDQDRTRGQLLLAGSTRFLTTRRLADTLTGRVGIVELLPLSAGELAGIQEGFIDAAFHGEDLAALQPEPMRRSDYAERIAIGGFPELALHTPSQRVRTAWCRSYVDTVTAPTNIEQVGDVRRPELPAALLSQLIARSAGEVVIADLARELRADENTVRTHLELLETLYLVRTLPAWTTSLTNRAKRRPTVHAVDTAIACHVLGQTTDSLAADPASTWFGPLLETYVVNELAKQAGWSEAPTTLHHYRDRDQREVDVILERHGQIVAIEVKATATPTSAHARHLNYLRSRAGKRFMLGVILHAGSQRVWLNDGIVALPVSALWADT